MKIQRSTDLDPANPRFDGQQTSIFLFPRLQVSLSRQ